MSLESRACSESGSTNLHIFPDGSKSKTSILLYETLWFSVQIELTPTCHLTACPPLCQTPDMYKDFFVVVSGHISWLPHPTTTFFLAYNLPWILLGGKKKICFNWKEMGKSRAFILRYSKCLEFSSKDFIWKELRLKVTFVQNNVTVFNNLILFSCIAICLMLPFY